MLAAVLVALLGALAAWRTIEDPADRCGIREWLRRLRRDGGERSSGSDRAESDEDGQPTTPRGEGAAEAQSPRAATAHPDGKRRSSRSGAVPPNDGKQHLTFYARGMRCSGCERAVEDAVGALAACSA